MLNQDEKFQNYYHTTFCSFDMWQRWPQRGECKFCASNDYPLAFTMGTKKQLTILILCSLIASWDTCPIFLSKDRLKIRVVTLESSYFKKVIHGISAIELNVHIFFMTVGSGYSGAIVTVVNEDCKWMFLWNLYVFRIYPSRKILGSQGHVSIIYQQSFSWEWVRLICVFFISIQQSLTVLVPRVWPFLHHTISSVRRAALETLFTLLSTQDQVRTNNYSDLEII